MEPHFLLGRCHRSDDTQTNNWFHSMCVAHQLHHINAFIKCIGCKKWTKNCIHSVWLLFILREREREMFVVPLLFGRLFNSICLTRFHRWYFIESLHVEETTNGFKMSQQWNDEEKEKEITFPDNIEMIKLAAEASAAASSVRLIAWMQKCRAWSFWIWSSYVVLVAGKPSAHHHHYHLQHVPNIVHSSTAPNSRRSEVVIAIVTLFMFNFFLCALVLWLSQIVFRLCVCWSGFSESSFDIFVNCLESCFNFLALWLICSFVRSVLPCPDFRSAFRLHSHICQMSHIFRYGRLWVLYRDFHFNSLVSYTYGMRVQFLGSRQLFLKIFFCFHGAFVTVHRLAHQITKQKSFCRRRRSIFISFLIRIIRKILSIVSPLFI